MANTKIIQQSKIDFTVDTVATKYTGWGKKYSNANNIDETYPADESDIAKSINAIEIDWNGAKPGIGEDTTNGITATGELLSSIKGVYSPMFLN